MPRYWTTGLMLLVLGGLGAYVYFVDLPAEEAKVQQEAQQATLIPFAEQDISAIALRSASGKVTLEADRDRLWSISAPIKAEADSRAVGALIRALVLGRVARVIEEEATDLAPFGLDKPSLTLTVSAGAQEETISLGDSGPLTSTLYALRHSERKVLLTTLAAKDFFNKTVSSLRKRAVLEFEPRKVERIRLTSRGNKFVIYKTRRAGKEEWQLRSPIAARADETEIRGFLLLLRDLKALGFIDPGPKREALASKLGNIKARVTLKVGGQDQTMSLYQPDPSSGEALVVTSEDRPVYRVSPAIVRAFDKDLFRLRDKRFLGTIPDDLAMLEVKTRTQEYRLINQNNQWVLEDKPEAKLNGQLVDLFVSRVVNLPAELQVLKRVGPLAPYGLASPSAEFLATDHQGNTRRMALGTRTSGLVYVKAEALPGIYQARADILDQVPARESLLDQG